MAIQVKFLEDTEVGEGLEFNGAFLNVEVDGASIVVNNDNELETTNIGVTTGMTYDPATNILSLVDAAGNQVGTADLSSLLDDTSVSSMVVDNTGIGTITKTDGSTITVDMTALKDDLTLSVVDSDSIALTLDANDELSAEVIHVDTSLEATEDAITLAVADTTITKDTVIVQNFSGDVKMVGFQV